MSAIVSIQAEQLYARYKHYERFLESDKNKNQGWRMKHKKITQIESLFNTGAYEPEVSEEKVLDIGINTNNNSSKKMIAQSKVLNNTTFSTEYECSNKVINNTNGMEDEWHQELQPETNILKQSKNLDEKSNVVDTKKFLEESEYQNITVLSLHVDTKVLNDESKILSSSEHQTTPVNFLEEETDVLKADVSRFATETFKLGRQRCGCLYKYLENKKLKDGTVASYPRVIGRRDPDNVKHWRWGFNWEEKIDGEWKNRSIGVPIGAVSMVIGMQNNNCSVNEIISFIKKSKAKNTRL